jgi:hypothetical protein
MEWHVECERSDVRGVLRHMCAYSHERLIPHVGLMEAGACERSKVRAGITKVREDYFDTKFHDDTQASESTHETITISQHHECCVTTHCNKSDVDIKKKI